MTEHPPADYIVLGLDIIKYSEKKLRQQMLAQQKIDRCFNDALKNKCPHESPMPHWIDAGDGGFALFKWAEMEIFEFLKEFYTRLDRENEDFTENDKKVLVRSAIYKDQVIVWESSIAGRDVKKFTGHAINNCARLMAGMLKDHDRQVVCSRPVLDAIMAIDRAASATRLKDITDKHGHKHEVWNLLVDPILGVKPIERELYPEPTLRVYPGSNR